MATRTINANMTIPALGMSADVVVSSPKVIDADMTLPALEISADVVVSSPKVIDADMTLPALEISAASEVVGTVQAWAALNVTFATGRIDYKPARVGRWPYHVLRRTVAAQDVQSHGSRETRAYAMRYGLRLAHPYAARYVNPTCAVHHVRSALRLMRVHDAIYATAPVARAAWRADYGQAPVARLAWVASYGQTRRARQMCDLPYASAPATRRAHSARYSLAAGAVRHSAGIAYAIADDARIRAMCAVGYGIDAPDAAVIAPMPAVVCAYGRLLRLSIGQGIDTVVWRASATAVMDIEPRAGDALDIAVDATRWRFMIVSARPTTLHPETIYELELRSVMPPLAQRTIRERPDRSLLHGGLASDLVRNLWPGVTVHWQTSDAVIAPPQMHTLWDMSADAATVALARACGGVALMRPEADRIDVLPPLSYACTVAAPIERQGTIAERPDIALVAREPRDAIAVRQIGRDRAEIVVTPNPARTVTLQVTAPHTLIESIEDVEQRDELIELRDGVGSVSAPILSLDRAQVYPDAMLRYADDAVWIDAPTPAAARVIYKTRILRAIVEGAPDTSSIAIVEDASP